jgi:hypothetical protein
MNLAPVIDIYNDSSKVLYKRCFYDDVSDCGIEYINGLKEQNIIATPKHFPGHGISRFDSHLMVPYIWNKKIEIHNQSDQDLKIELYAQEMDEKGDVSREGLLKYFNKNTDKTREALICKGESHLILSIFDAERDDKKNTNGNTNNSFDPTDEFLYTRYMVAQRTQVASAESNQPFEIMYDFYNIP